MLQTNQSHSHCIQPPGPRHHSALPQSQIQGSRSTLNPMLSSFPTSALGVRSREKTSHKSHNYSLRHEKCLFLFPDRAPVVNGRVCMLRKQTGKPRPGRVCIGCQQQRQWFQRWGPITGCRMGCGWDGTQFSPLWASVTLQSAVYLSLFFPDPRSLTFSHFLFLYVFYDQWFLLRESSLAAFACI